MSAAQRKIDLIFNYFVARVRAAGVLSVLHRSCNSKILNQRKNTCWGVGEYSAWNALSAERIPIVCGAQCAARLSATALNGIRRATNDLRGLRYTLREFNPSVEAVRHRRSYYPALPAWMLSKTITNRTSMLF